MFNIPIPVFRELILTILLAATIFYDLRYRIVPNFLIVLSLAAGFIMTGMEGITTLLKTITVAVLLSYPAFYGYERGWMGGGDVKLVVAISLIAGEELAKFYFFVGSLGGGMLSLFCLVVNRLKQQSNGNTRQKQLVMIPYAAAHAAAVLAVQTAFWLSSK